MRGHVRKRGSKWAFVIDVGYDEDGHRRQKWHSGFATKKAAEKALSETLNRVHEGTYVEPHKLTVAKFLHSWLEGIKPTIRLSTWSAYKMLAETHIIPTLGTALLQKLTPAQLNGLYATLSEKGRRDGKGGLSPRSVRYVHATIRKALSDAVKQGLVVRNVADQATPPAHKQSSALSTWTAPELRAFLDHIEPDRLYAAYLLAATSGMRRGEVLGLRWRDVDLEQGRLHIQQTLVAVDYAVTVSTPKTARGRRSVALDPVTVSVMKAHRIRQAEERLMLGLGAARDDGLVFTDLDGEPLHPGQFSDRFDRLVKAAGVPRIRFHDLRHTHATLSLKAGVHPKVVSERLGHSTVSITLDIYSHAIPAMQEEAAARVAVLVFGAQAG